MDMGDTSRRHPSRPHKRRRIYTPPILTSLLLFCSIFISLPLVRSAPTCLRFADAVTINQLFTDGGPGTKVLLCPSKVYHLTSTIVFTAADQELATFGYPTGPERATLRVQTPNLATAIQGDCRRCARIKVHSLIIDGNRAGLGRMLEFDPSGLIVIGGNEGQSVKQCKVMDPRGFTAVHVREGDKLSCTGAVIEKNEIGPVGDEYDPAVDGDDPEMSPIGRPLADGISIACRDSFVRDNTFFDNTAAAIVIFCSPGTLVQANHIYAKKTSMMGGILMVDSTPFDGDYSKMVVKSNIINAVSRTIRVGIGIGAAVWSDDIDTILKGGSVIANGFKGNYMGYSIAAAGLNAWTIKDNWDESVHQGKRSARCFEEPINPDPMSFLYYGDTVKESDIQSGFTDGEFQYVVCIDGLEDSSSPVKAATITQTIEEPTSKAALPAETHPALVKDAEVDFFSTGSEVMDDILEHSQQRMLEAFAHLSERVDGLAAHRPASRSAANQPPADIGTALGHLRSRIETIETRQQDHMKVMNQLRVSIKSWDQDLHEQIRWQTDAIHSVEEKLYVLMGDNSKAGKEKARKTTSGISPGIKRSSITGLSGTLGGTLTSILEVFSVSIIIALLCEVVKRYWGKRRTHRKSM